MLLTPLVNYSVPMLLTPLVNYSVPMLLTPPFSLHSTFAPHTDALEVVAMEGEADMNTDVSMTTETGSEAEVDTGAPDTIETAAVRGTERERGSTGDEIMSLGRCNEGVGESLVETLDCLSSSQYFVC